MAGIVLEGVTKLFPGGSVAVRELDLTVEDGELLVLVGPSGCGKSTVLRMIAGLEQPTKGVIRIGDRVVNELAPGDRDVAMVFQDYALYPHMNAYQNVAFALRPARLPKKELNRRVREAAALLGIQTLLGRRPGALSGGERQRVAMARAIVRRPVAFLMDEPLSNLDAKLRVQVRTEIRRLHQELGTTFVYVTHDQVEAMTLGGRVAVMRHGELQQVDPPRRLYDRPANVFVAGFVGSPGTNLVLAPVMRDDRDGTATVQVGPWAVAVPDATGDQVIVGLRPEHFEDASLAKGPAPGTEGEVVVHEVEPLGATSLVHFEVDAAPVTADGVVASGAGGAFAVGAPPARFVAQVDGRTRAMAGSPLRLVVDLVELRFFDPASGSSLGASALAAGEDHSLAEGPLGQEEHDQAGQEGKNRGRHQVGPLGVVDVLEEVEPEGQGVAVLVGQVQQRTEEVVPGADEGEGGHQGDRRPGLGDDDPQQDRQEAVTLHPGGVVVFARDGQEELAEEKDVEGSAAEEGRHHQG